jgi:hypothetical protein
MYVCVFFESARARERERERQTSLAGGEMEVEKRFLKQHSA